MDHQSHCHRVENTRLGQGDLAATGLLGRSTEYKHRDAELVRDLGEATRGSHRSCGDHVVTARMPDSGQRIVLGTQPDNEVPGAVGSRKSCGQIRHTDVDGEAVIVEQIGDLGHAAVLGKRQFGLGVE